VLFIQINPWKRKGNSNYGWLRIYGATPHKVKPIHTYGFKIILDANESAPVGKRAKEKAKAGDGCQEAGDG
jgi:hypothetical protein